MPRTFRARALALLLATAVPGSSAGAPDGLVYPDLPADQRSYGGPFALTDHHGRPFDQDALRGGFSLLYFGYTDCADVCPGALYTIGQALDALGEDGRAVRALFVNLDAERDNPADLARYVGFFHPRLLGLTGSAEAIARAARAFRVHYFRAADGARLEHSGFTFLIGPDGRPLTYFPHGAEPEDIAATLRAHLARSR